MSVFYNDGLGLNSTGGDSQDIINLKAKDLLIDLDIQNLNNAISNLDPEDVSGIITGLQNTDAEFAIDISNLYVGYSNNSNLIANIPVGSNYDSVIQALQLKDSFLTSNVASLNTGISNNSNAIASIIIPDYETEIQSLIDKDGFLDLDVIVLNSSISNLITKDTNLDANILSLQTKDNALDVEIEALQTKDISLDNDIASLIAKDAFLDLNVSSLNAGVSNLSVLSSNYSTITQLTADLLNVNTGYSNNNSLITNLTIKESGDTTNMNAGISNLATLSSNYVNLNGLQTLTNKTFLYSANNFIGFPTGSGSNGGGSNYDEAIFNLQQKDIAIDGEIVLLQDSDLALNASIVDLQNVDDAILLSIEALQSIDTTLSNQIIALQTKDTSLDGQITTLTNKDTALDAQIATLQTKDTSLDANVLALQNKDTALDGQILTLQNKDVFLDVDIGMLNTGYSNNFGLINNLTTVVTNNGTSLNAGISNLSTLSSNYATVDQTVANYANLNTSISNNSTLISSLTTKQAGDVANLNSGISNNTSSISTVAIDLAFQVAKEAIDVNSLNFGYSNNASLIATNTTNIANQVSKEALDVSFLNTGYSNNLGLININTNNLSTLTTKQLNDVSSLNAVSSNLSTLSSNYATLTGTQTLTNKTIDYNLNTFLNLPSGGGGTGSSITYKNGIITDPTAGTVTYAHGLGTTPTRIKFEAKASTTSAIGAGSSHITTSFGTYDGSGNKVIGTYILSTSAGDGASYSATDKCIMLQNNGGNTATTGILSGVVSAVDATNFTIVWSLTGSLNNMDNRSVLWSAQGGGGAGTNDPLAVETFTNKTMSFNSNTFTSFPYSIAPSTHLANYIPKWNGTADSKTLVEGVVAPSGAIVGTTDAQTLTGKTMAFANNTFTGFPTGSGGSEFTTTSLKTANYTAVTGDEVIVDANGATANFTITLPATPSVGNIVRIVMVTEHVTRVVLIGRNGSPIDGRTATEGEIYHTLWRNGDTVTFKYLGGSAGWVSIIRNIANRFILNYFNLSNQTIATGTFTKPIINTKNTDPANMYSTSTYDFTVPISGKWQITYGTRSDPGMTTNQRFFFVMLINGTQSSYIADGTGTPTWTTRSFNNTIEFTAGNTVSAQIYHEKGSNQIFNMHFVSAVLVTR